MNQTELVARVRALTRDFNGSIFRETDVLNFINEAIDRVREIVTELQTMSYPKDSNSEIEMLPQQYHHLLAVYSASRCLFQDEQDYRAGTLMNEFELKLEELLGKIADGSIVIKNPDGSEVTQAYVEDYVQDIYFDKSISDDDYFS